MGLLGDNFEDPKTLAILGAAASLLGAAGPRVGPRSMFGDIGQALQGGLQGYGAGLQFKNQAARQKLFEQQAQLAELQAKKQMGIMDFVGQRLGVGGMAGGAGGGGPVAPGAVGGALPPSFGGAMPGAGGPLPVEQRSLMPTDGGGEMGGAGDAAGGSMPGGMPDLASMLVNAPMRQQPAPQPQGGPANGPGGGSAFPFNLNEVIALKAAGGPDLLEGLKYANQGSKFDPGAMYRLPNGQVVMVPKLGEGMAMGQDGTVMNAPGYVRSNAEAKGAETYAQERARAGFNTAMIPTRDGGSVPAFQVFGGPGGMPGAGGGGFGSAPGPLGGQTPGDKTYSEDTAKAAADKYTGLQAEADKAGGDIQRYRQLGDMLKEFKGGKLTEAGVEIASSMNSLGIKIPGLSDNLGNAQAAQMLAKQLANGMRERGTGPMTDQDYKVYASTVPNLDKSAEARQKMVDMYVATLERKQLEAEFARQWVARAPNGRLDARDPEGKTFQDRMQAYNKANPVFGGIK